METSYRGAGDQYPRKFFRHAKGKHQRHQISKQVCYNLKRLLKWTRNEPENTEKRLSKLAFRLWQFLMPQATKSRLVVVDSG